MMPRTPGPGETWASFVEACRKGRLKVMDASNVVQTATSGPRFREAKLMWDPAELPVYAFEEIGPLIPRVAELPAWKEEHPLVLPHDAFVLTLNLYPEEPDLPPDLLQQSVWVCHRHPDQPDMLAIVEFSRDLRPGTSVPTPWHAWPLAAGIGISNWKKLDGMLYREKNFPPFAEKDVGFDRDRDSRALWDIAQWTRLCLVALAHPQLVENEAAAEDNYTREVNAGRIRAGRAPVVTVRTIRLTHRAGSRHTGGGQSGREVSGHFRRSHLRTLSDGRTVPVRQAAVKGGPQGPAPVFRVVP